jgi:nicotinamide-nucleotide amidase
VALLVAAEIIAVGSELLTPTRVDTNSLFITERLNACGIAVRAKTVVGDSRADLAAVLTSALARVDLVVLTGGLGPTDDDLTREVVSQVLARPLHEDPALVERLRARFARRGLDMPEINRRQALVPEGAEVLSNANGTAPGLWLEDGSKVVVLLPGPPREIRPMVDALVASRIGPRAGGTVIVTRMLRVAGYTESHAEQAAMPLYARWRDERRPIDATTLAAPGSIDFHLTARAPTPVEGQRLLAAAVAELAGAFGDAAYSNDGRSMEEVVGELLRTSRLTLAAAESCTGGLLTSRLTDVPGSSAYVERGVVAYSNQAKIDLLDVPADLIARHGAVSEPVAAAMARGVRVRAGAAIGVGITGIAGPEGGTREKPVGTVAIAVEGPWGAGVSTRTFPGDRAQIKFSATQAALDELRRALLRWQRGS